MERDLSEFLDKIDAAEAENLESVYLYDKAYDEGYAKAIDEFAEKVLTKLEKAKEECYVLETTTGEPYKYYCQRQAFENAIDMVKGAVQNENIKQEKD